MISETERLRLLYENYDSWRQSSFQSNLEAEHKIIAAEFSRLRLPTKATVLEVGFGEGHVMDWARDQGYQVEGVEITAGYVEAARNRGHNVFHGTISDIDLGKARKYDAIVCFDVLEHMNESQIVEFFASAKAILSDDGVILARFPNASSPIGLYYQYGDATHVSALTGLKVDQLAMLEGLRVTHSLNAMRTIPGRRRYFRVDAYFRHLASRFIEWLIGDVYFGERLPMAPNLVVHIRHDSYLPK